MTATPQGNLGVQLGERLFELGVTENVCQRPKKLELIRTGKGVLVVTGTMHNRLKPRQWGVARPDMPWRVFLKEVLP